ncbi:hypothetical protein HMPREF9622_02819 [Cutibacterium modestum HL037PA3]|uniref:Uncharacterized protein n=1 Tax=Cutibacterium modestum HL044PA1 TaxID=765109 RepID=A0ABP2K8G8_9ACTN|nr:hypothetical protein HMPREF9621_02626 [Cutibacterium modestum HL037PA2]EFS92085.1 hypothetical protein HMPREF9607_01713 [Cutibacterium modestum HL044PA1]EFT14182.1 hypothetical protein HMPREF9622_02819 [Cutibacterium modestum HL037PA3]
MNLVTSLDQSIDPSNGVDGQCRTDDKYSHTSPFHTALHTDTHFPLKAPVSLHSTVTHIATGGD